MNRLTHVMSACLFSGLHLRLFERPAACTGRSPDALLPLTHCGRKSQLLVAELATHTATRSNPTRLVGAVIRYGAQWSWTASGASTSKMTVPDRPATSEGPRHGDTATPFWEGRSGSPPARSPRRPSHGDRLRPFAVLVPIAGPPVQLTDIGGLLVQQARRNTSAKSR